MQKLSKLIEFIRRQPRWRLWAVGGAIVVVGFLAFRSDGGGMRNAPTFDARRGSLDITVVEGGSLQALEYQDFKCEVRVGYQGTKILKIVDEGYLVTEADVEEGKVLCELDSSDLQDKVVQQEIQYQSAMASLTDAEQNYEIQLSQNQSDVKAAEQKARFARMDFDKFLGDTVTEEIIEEIGLDRLLEFAASNAVAIADASGGSGSELGSGSGSGSESESESESELNSESGSGSELGSGSESGSGSGSGSGSETESEMGLELELEGVAGAVAVPSNGDGAVVWAVSAEGAGDMAAPPDVALSAPPPLEPPIDASLADELASGAPQIAPPPVDFSKYANIELLGDGEAKQKLRKLEDDLQVAQKELGQAGTTLEGTRRLFERGFVPKTEITRDEIAYESARLKVQTAETAQALFLKYEFVKSAEESMSKYVEAVRELVKARRVAISKLAQARAKLNSARGSYDVQSKQREDLQDQLGKCVMRAEKPGLVVYGSGRGEMIYYGDQEPIREGATVRERQAILTIPDLTRMSVDVRIHESYIKKVKKGLKARITVDAFPDEMLAGEVTKVAVLPDSQNRWMNPDLKVYLCTIAVDGTHDWVKPGMSAKVEIVVGHLDDVVYIPVQAVVPEGRDHVCYVGGRFKPLRRVVEVGEFNDEFIEIKEGLAAGEPVLLNPPDATGEVPGAGGEEEPIPAEGGDAEGTAEAPPAGPAASA